MAARTPIVQNAGSLQQLQSGDTLNATIQGVRLYAKSATDPSSPTPVDGDLYYNTAINEWMQYDGSRTKWLSVTTYTFVAGRSGGTFAGAYYRGPDGLAFGTNVGYEVPKGSLDDGNSGRRQRDLDSRARRLRGRGIELDEE
jgi:hypothetical protein